MVGAGCMLSVFIREPEFQGQTKDRLATAEAQRIVENAIKDPFDHWLAGNPHAGQQAARLRRRPRRGAHPPPPGKGHFAQDRGAQAPPARQARRLHQRPGRRARRSSSSRATSAGGSAKQARDRASQAVLPLRGKILNVQSAGKDKLAQNAQLADLVQALGCGTGERYRDDDLRYEKVIIMTDADVDGAHIASLLITFFYSPDAEADRARPPLSRGAAALSPLPRRQDRSMRATTSTRTNCCKKEFHANANVEIGRFKGLGEMMAAQLKETTMDPRQAHAAAGRARGRRPEATAKSVERLMGTKAEARFEFIQERAEFADEAALDV